MLLYMRRTSSGNSWITSIFQTNVLKLRLTYADISTLIPSRQLPHTYQQLYHAFSQQPSHHKRVMDGNGRSLSWERRNRRQRRPICGTGGRGGRGGRGKVNINLSGNVVNISNPTRWYGKEKWSRFRFNTQ